MCLICVEYQQGKLTYREAMNNYFEAGPKPHVVDAIRLMEHIQELRDKTQTPNVTQTLEIKIKELECLTQI